MKKCSKCLEVKELCDFNKHRSRKDGLLSFCAPCDRAKSSSWRAINGARHSANNAAWRSKNRERNAATKAAWVRNNPEKRSQIDRRRRAAKLLLPSIDYTRNSIYEREQATCHICNEHVTLKEFHIEHLVPLQPTTGALEQFKISSHPGDVPWNVSIAHPSCNVSKGNRMSQDDADKYFKLLQHYGELNDIDT